MINGILGKKLGMTQVFDERGNLIPVTVIEAGPCYVSQIKTFETDGYEAVQLAYGKIKEAKVNRPQKGHFKKSGTAPKKYLREFSVDDINEVTSGQEVKADIFKVGEPIKVTGISKGKGFAGAVKRHHFHGADMTHGSMIHRKPQSNGATDAARVFKGARRPGQMGNKRITQRGLTVYRVDPMRNLLLVIGSVPGATGSLVMVSRQLAGG
ncbi:MAG: 50S ribosomal protein L3 [Armatimonadota bacterium]